MPKEKPQVFLLTTGGAYNVALHVKEPFRRLEKFPGVLVSSYTGICISSSELITPMLNILNFILLKSC